MSEREEKILKSFRENKAYMEDRIQRGIEYCAFFLYNEVVKAKLPPEKKILYENKEMRQSVCSASLRYGEICDKMSINFEYYFKRRSARKRSFRKC